MPVSGNVLVNGMHAGAAAFGLYSCPPMDNPFAFSAMAYALFHGLLGVVNSFREEEKPCSKVHVISRAVMEINLLALINVELYLASSLSEAAFVHFLYVIPMAFDMITKLYSEESTEGATEILKDMTILGNCLSMIYLAVCEDKPLYYGISVSAFCSRYVSMLFENHIPCIGEYCVLLFDAAVIIFAALCVNL